MGMHHIHPSLDQVTYRDAHVTVAVLSTRATNTSLPPLLVRLVLLMVIPAEPKLPAT